jgi:phosphoribosylformylglycinamidine (FGAM) synthase-like amidotransferase family enzyme
MKNVYIVNRDGAYKRLFLEIGFAVTDTFANADLVCFTGGEDVTPSLYGDSPHKHTYNSWKRDQIEAMVFKSALDKGIPMVGICRGAQFLNVMSGGRMYQHVSNHTRSHSITDLETGETVWVSSTHHQMMMPSPKGFLVASSTLGGSREWMDGQVMKKDISTEDIEVVFYEHTKSLCFQPHPEMIGSEWDIMKDYFKELLSRKLGMS